MNGLGINAVDSINESGVGAEVLTLFREHTVVEVKDYILELSNQIEKTHHRFIEELQEHYRDILTVTDEVGLLFSTLKDGDSLLMDLCFKDDVYRVNKLPEIAQGSSSSTLNRRLSITQEELAIPYESSAEDVLLVSKWTLAVTDFISRFTTSSNSNKLFDKVIQEFGNLKNHASEAFTYKDIIASKCKEFLYFITKNDDCQGIFTINQWVRIYNLVLKERDTRFEWVPALAEELDSIVFQVVLDEYPDTLFSSKDELVKQFTCSEIFQEKLGEKILRDINEQFECLEKLSTEDIEPSNILSYQDLPSEGISVGDIVEESRLYSMGLVTTKRVAIFKIVTPLIEMLRNLESHGRGHQLVKELKAKLIAKLEQSLPADRGESNSELEINHEGNSKKMDDLIAEVIQKHNDENYKKLIKSQIRNLSSF